MPALVAVGVVVLGALFVVPQADKALLPTLRDPNLLVQWAAAPGTSLPEMDRITARATAELRGLAGVHSVGTQVGQAVLGDQPVGSDSAQTWISLDGDADYAETVAAVRQVVAGYPGLDTELLTYSSDRMRSVLGRTSDEVTVRIFGSDLGVLQAKAEEVKGVVSGIDGVDGARVASVAAEPTMEVEVDLVKARDVGVKPGDVRRAAATLLSGIRAGNLFEDQKVFDVQIWSTPETRNSLSSVQDLLIDTPSGTPVRLGDVATVRVRPSPPVIRHEDISRFVDVTADVSGRAVGEVAADLRSSLDAVDFPLEYHAELVGDYSDQQAAQNRLMGFGIAAAIGVFLLLQAAFGSWRLAAIVFVLLPVALAGGLLAAWIDGGPWTLATAAGSLGVLAFALRSLVSLMGRYQRLRADGVPFGPDVVDRGTRDHVTPLVVAALGSAVVLLPAVVSGGVAGLEVLHPMAVVLIGGLLTSTLTALFLAPVAVPAVRSSARARAVRPLRRARDGGTRAGDGHRRWLTERGCAWKDHCNERLPSWWRSWPPRRSWRAPVAPARRRPSVERRRSRPSRVPSSAASPSPTTPPGASTSTPKRWPSTLRAAPRSPTPPCSTTPRAARGPSSRAKGWPSSENPSPSVASRGRWRS